jgi:hypothetical protein
MNDDIDDDIDDDRTYFDLEIAGRSSDAEIWLSDDAGHLVQKEIGVLRSELIPGHYVVEFELGGRCYPIELRADLKLTQEQIEAGPTCERPAVRLG